MWEINALDLYRAECSCSANWPLWFPHWARELKRIVFTVLFLSCYQYPPGKMIFVFLFCWGVWEPWQKNGNWALLLLKVTVGPSQRAANVIWKDLLIKLLCHAWHSPSPALCLSVCVETWEMMLIFELLCLEEERNVWELFMWSSPSLLLIYGIKSFVEEIMG